MWQNETTSEMKRVGLYIRVSTEDQATEWTSLESQERILKAFVEANSDKGWITNDALLYKDEGVSGALPAIDRPWLSRLMKDVLNGGLDIVCVYRVDRIYRNTRELLGAVEFFQEHNVQFCSKSEWLDVSTATGKLTLTLLGAIGELERHTIASRCQLGRQTRARDWYFSYGQFTPYGYKKEHDGRGNLLVEDNEEAQILKEIFQLYVYEDKTLWEIANILSARWVPTRRNENKKQSWLFRSTLVARILHAESSTGVFYCNKTETKRKGSQIIKRDRDRSEWIGVPCPRIIDQKTWNLAQEKLAKAKAITSGRGARHYYTGLVKCWICGFTFNSYKTKKGTINLVCWGRKKDKVTKHLLCINPEISELKLHQAVRPVLTDILTHAEKFIHDHEESEDELHDSIEKMSSKKNSLLSLKISARNPNSNKQYSEKLLNLQRIKKHLRISFMMYEKKSQLLNFGDKKYKTNLYIFEKEPMDMTWSVKWNKSTRVNSENLLKKIGWNWLINL
jgi:DNA invertase Pin-like site-specific DNA recombinase